jgi:hypothetical protein
VRRYAILVALLVLAGAGAARAASLREIFFARPITRPVGDALAASVGRSLPVTAASSGVTFRFDPRTSAFERETDILGQLFLERPRPLGRGRVNLSLSYQWVPLDTVDGNDFDRLSDTRFPILDPGTRVPFVVPRFGVDLDSHQVTAGATYGVTDELDLNLTVPLVHTDVGVRAVARVVGGRAQSDRFHDAKTGPGDVFLRAKQRLVRGRWGQAAAGLVLRAPAGDEDDFQGTGDWQLAPMLYAATPSWRPTPRLRFDGYANAGVDLNADDVDRSEGRFGVGIDGALADRVTLAVAVLGREPFAGIAPPGAFDVLRVDRRTGRQLTAPVFGLERDRASAYDLSVGGRLNLWRDTVFLFANVLLPLNRDGYRSDVVPLAGVEAAF